LLYSPQVGHAAYYPPANPATVVVMSENSGRELVVMISPSSVVMMASDGTPYSQRSGE
jgi:hypothetical protein